MNDQLIHILDQSACLSRRQVRDYLAGAMVAEEEHAVELHLIACPLCGLAMEGLEARPAEAAVSLAELNTGFLKAYFDTQAPQIHLNSMSPAHALSASNRRQHGHSQPKFKHAAIISMLAAAFCLIWYFEFGRKKSQNTIVPTATVSEIKSAPVPVTLPAETPPAHSNKQTHKEKLHPTDEALIDEAKAMNAKAPVELTDEELTKVFDASTADESKEIPTQTTNARPTHSTQPVGDSPNSESKAASAHHDDSLTGEKPIAADSTSAQ